LQNRILANYNWDKPKTCAHDYLLGTIVRILDRVNVPKTAHILDAGCGGGYVMHELYRKGYENIRGFDASKAG
jgi:2-polyprenyl-3-methyl-5-hydroxy-6-metoxy-1,4-benzoquinol methylase